MSPDDTDRERGGGAHRPAMPLKVLVVSDLDSRSAPGGGQAPPAGRLRLDKDSFEAVMAGFGLACSLRVADRLSGKKDPLPIDLRFPDLKAFRPEAVAEQIPSTRDLLQIRETLLAVRAGRTTLDEARERVERLPESSPLVGRVRALLRGEAGERPAGSSAPARQAPEAAGSGLDALLEKVEAPPESSGGDRFDPEVFDSLLQSLLASGRAGGSIEPRAADALMRSLDAAIGSQLDEVLHDPEFVRLESAWRGLKLLVDRIDFRQPIRLEVLTAGKKTLLARYDELVHHPESDGVSEEPLSLVVVDHAFTNHPEDLDLLRALAERGSSLSLPVVVSASAAMLGLAAADLAGKSGLREIFAGDAMAKWRGLRAYAPSRWLAVVFNRILLRPPYASDGVRTRGFDYTESLPSDGLRPWGNGGWAVAVLAARSFARLGWCTDIMGQRPSGMVEDLPVRATRHGSQTVSLPLETAVPDAVERDLNDNGIMTLTAALNSDRAVLRLAPSAHQPGHYPDPADRARARLQSTLPFQLFVSRVVHYSMLIEGRVVPGRAAEQIQADYDRELRELLRSAGPVPPDAVQVRVLPNEEDASRSDLALTIRWPGHQSLPGVGDLELRWPLNS